MLAERSFTDAGAAADWLAADVAGRLRDAIASRGCASLVVSGGRSPVTLFHRLRECALDWSRVWVTLADERWVDPTAEDSNDRLIREHLLTGNAAPAHFVPLKSPAPQPLDALAERSQALAAMPHPFDVVLLGMGEDGHTASLFPGADGLADALDPSSPALLAAIEPPHASHPRITLTLAALLDARWIAVQLQGEAKRCVYKRARNNSSPAQYPIGAVLNQRRVPVVVCLIDGEQA